MHGGGDDASNPITLPWSVIHQDANAPGTGSADMPPTTKPKKLSETLDERGA
ncbi:hypothetical protein QFZ22_009623 [Streptomyces canus]|uniref:Uncharacterized protein n=1 Tax=Streptomyces canus TaxID=58343 RepID=A0AAW8FTX5_9ACTN|nr:hypothetical protein [Streptomyces canus]